MTIDKTHSEKRGAERHLIEDGFIVNSGEPYRGGQIKDVSSTGAGVRFLRHPTPLDETIKKGEELELCVEGKNGFVGHIVWLTNLGFGMKFKKNW